MSDTSGTGRGFFNRGRSKKQPVEPPASTDGDAAVTDTPPPSPDPVPIVLVEPTFQPVGTAVLSPADPVVQFTQAVDPTVLASQPFPTDITELPPTAGEGSSPWTPVGEAGTVGTIQQVAEPAAAEPVTLDVAARTPGVEADLAVMTTDPVRDPTFVPGDTLLGDPALGDPAALPGIEPEVAIATALPDGTAIAGGLAGMTIGSITIDTEPNHLGVDLSVDGITPTGAIADALGVVSPATATATVAPAGTGGSGNLGPLPGASLYGAEAEPGVVDKVVEVVKDVAEWVKNVPDWLKIDGSEGTPAPPPATTGPLKPWKNQYDNPDADPILAAPSVVVGQIITTGLDPTTTTPGVVDDAEPITADDLAGAGPVGGLNIPVNPLVIDSTGEAAIAFGGDIGVRFDATGPDVVGPNDPILGGAEPITAGDLTSPPGTANPIAGGEDEDLEDLEIQRFTPRASTIAGGEDEDLEDLEIQRFDPTVNPRAGTMLDLGDAVAESFQPVGAETVSLATPMPDEAMLTASGPTADAVTAVSVAPISASAILDPVELAQTPAIGNLSGTAGWAADFAVDFAVDETVVLALEEPALSPIDSEAVDIFARDLTDDAPAMDWGGDGN